MGEYIPPTRPACQRPYFLTVEQRANPSQPGWKLADYAYIPAPEPSVPEDCSECNNGGVNIYVRALDTEGEYVAGIDAFQEFPTGTGVKTLAPRGDLDYCYDPQGKTYYGAAFEMSGDSSFSTDRHEVGPYSVHLEGGNSDTLHGMGLPSRRHVQFVLTYVRVLGDEEPEPPPTPEDDPVKEGYIYRVKRADGARITLVRVK